MRNVRHLRTVLERWSTVLFVASTNFITISLCLKYISSSSLWRQHSYLHTIFLSVVQIGIVLKPMIFIDLNTFRIPSFSVHPIERDALFVIVYLSLKHLPKLLTSPRLTVHRYLAIFCRKVDTSIPALNYPIFIGIRNQSQYGVRVKKIKNSCKIITTKKTKIGGNCCECFFHLNRIIRIVKKSISDGVTGS